MSLLIMIIVIIIIFIDVVPYNTDVIAVFVIAVISGVAIGTHSFFVYVLMCVIVYLFEFCLFGWFIGWVGVFVCFFVR